MISDKTLPGYCRLHCRTERALFVGAHTNRLLKLAGNPPGYDAEVPAEDWYSLGPGYIDPLCDLADERKKRL